jgi:hypothetical protein
MMAIQYKRNDGLPFTSPRVRGEVGAQRRVRGALRESKPVERAPHPDPLPVKNGEREWHRALFGQGG